MGMNFKMPLCLHSSYEDKEGRSFVVLRVFLNGEMANFGSTKVFADKSLWDNTTSRLRGWTTETLSANAALDSTSTMLNSIYYKLEDDESLSLDKIHSFFIEKDREYATFLPIFDKFNEDVRQRVEHITSKDSLQKYSVSRRHFIEFLIYKYGKKDIGPAKFMPSTVQDFGLYLSTAVGCAYNTSVKKLKVLKAMTVRTQKRSHLPHDPFFSHCLHLGPINRGFFMDREIMKIANKEIAIQRLELVRNVFVFSCFTGLARINVSNLIPDNIVTLDDKQWITTKRWKTGVETNVLLLGIPKSIITKYSHKTYRGGKLFPILTNRKTNAYLKRIADIRGIKKNLTFYPARHTFATMSLSKGVPMESVLEMSGYTNIETIQLYARIANKKVEHDMGQLADKLGKFNRTAGIR